LPVTVDEFCAMYYVSLQLLSLVCTHRLITTITSGRSATRWSLGYVSGSRGHDRDMSLVKVCYMSLLDHTVACHRFAAVSDVSLCYLRQCVTYDAVLATSCCVTSRCVKSRCVTYDNVMKFK